MSDIIEYNTYFEFELIYFNQKHGSYAIYCLDEIPTKSCKIRLHKKNEG